MSSVSSPYLAVKQICEVSNGTKSINIKSHDKKHIYNKVVLSKTTRVPLEKLYNHSFSKLSQNYSTKLANIHFYSYVLYSVICASRVAHQIKE